MSENNLQSKIKELRELMRMSEELQQEIDSIKDVIKAEMVSRNTEEIISGEYKVRYTTVKSRRFNSVAFKANQPELYNQYSTETITKRFSVA